NYFLKDANGEFLNHKNDKSVWLKWMELRVNEEVDAIKTPTGYIPLYDDLKRLFNETLHKDYTKKDYIKQFTMRVPENLAKIDRLVKIYKQRVSNAPFAVFTVLGEQKERLEKARSEYGDYIQPDELAG
ncbi:MAG: phosphoenolpyruvate carboxykinase (GTP), partial [Theionarchaea archaeon]|nr:phosphoenolpyruvate carboxykinase (GTP) [Theionarchaea archaeon]